MTETDGISEIFANMTDEYWKTPRIKTYLETKKDGKIHQERVLSIIHASEVYGCTRSRISAMLRSGRLEAHTDTRGRKWVLEKGLRALMWENGLELGSTPYDAEIERLEGGESGLHTK